MDMNLIDSYIDNIAELIIDEDKIVTYKTLSRKYGIHVNTAKQLLYKFLIDQKAKGQILSATYLLAGKFPDGSFIVTVVNEQDLNSASAKFSEITSEHVYSIHKGKKFTEVKLLCDSEADKNKIESSNIVIQCSKSIIRSTKNVIQKSEVQNNALPIKNKVDTKSVPEKEMKEALCNQQLNKIVESPDKKDNLSRSPKKTSPTQIKSKTNTSKGPGNKQQKGNIANFFANVAQKANNALQNKKNLLNNENKSTTEIVNKEEEVKEKVLAKTNRSCSKENKNKKSRNKRKRIQVLSDSEDESSDSDSGKEEPQFVEESPPTPPPIVVELEEEKKTTNEKPPKNKRKKRKIVDKTVMNEDGYMETRKEVVLETDSEEENDEKSVTKKGNVEQKKIKLNEENEQSKPSLSNARKQSSLLNFFKKN